MLIVLVTVVHRSGRRTVLTGEIANVSDLRAVSAYEAWLDDRDGGRLAGYPRWSEPVRALVARCIALSRPRPAKAVAGRRPRTDSAQARIGWARLRVDIGLKPGGHGRVRRLAMVRMVRPGPALSSISKADSTLATSDRVDAISLGWIEGPLRGHREIAPLPGCLEPGRARPHRIGVPEGRADRTRCLGHSRSTERFVVVHPRQRHPGAGAQRFRMASKAQR